MTILDGAQIKVVVDLELPDAVIAKNVFYMKCDFTDAQTEQDVEDALDAWISGLYVTIDDLMFTGVDIILMSWYTYDGIAQQWDPEGTALPNFTATDATTMLPHGVSALVRAYSENARSIARKYLPGFTETQFGGSGWVAGAITALTAFANAWSTDEVITAGNILHPAVFSTTQGGLFELNGVEVILADPAYQRRRRPGTGT